MKFENSSCSGNTQSSYEVPKNLLCALTYLLGGISGFIALHLKPYNLDQVIRLHAWQSICFSVAWFLVSLLLDLLLESFFYANSAGPGSVFLVSIVNLGLSVGGLLLWIKQMLSSYNGEYFHIPIVSEISIKLANATRKAKGGER